MNELSGRVGSQQEGAVQSGSDFVLRHLKPNMFYLMVPNT
jgi:hypothetical protein